MPQQPLKLLRASAGSGKTFSLTLQYLTILFSAAHKYKEILAVTFTNKATAEMKARILSALQAIAKGEASAFQPLLLQAYTELNADLLQAKARTIYSNILHDYGRFSVSTIDGFVQKVIRSFAFELNLDSGYKLEMNQDKVKEELVRSMNLQMESDPELLEWVTALAIERISDGKDWNYQRALKDLANEIFKERYYPFQEAMLQMGDERSNEFNALKQTVQQGIRDFDDNMVNQAKDLQYLFELADVAPEDLAGKSRNPLLKLPKIIQKDYSGIPALINMVDDFSTWPHGSLKDTSAVSQLYADVNPGLKKLVLDYLAGAEQYATFLAIHKNASYLRLMQEMALQLKNYRAEHKVLLISDAQQLLTGITGADAENPSFIWEKTGSRYRHFLFDEFQDTSSMQWANFLPLIRNALAEFEGKHAEHLIVGDVKQSIYRWRSGDWRILHSNVKRDVMLQHVGEENLEYNRRSSANIIRFNNFLYGHLPAILQGQLNGILAETEREDLLTYWHEDYHQIIDKAYEGNFQQSTADTPAGGKVELQFLAREDEMDNDDVSPVSAVYAVNKIISLLADSGMAMKDICVLVRVNREAEVMIAALLNKQAELSLAAGKTFQVISGDALKIASNLAVQLLINIFRTLLIRPEEQAIYRATCARLYNQILYPEGKDAKPNDGEQSARFGQVALNAEDWMKIATKPIQLLGAYFPEEFCRDFDLFKQLPMTGLMDRMVRIFGLGEPAQAHHIPFILALRDQVALFASGGDHGLEVFLDWWDEEGSKKALPAADDQDAVQIMTIHKSKGLEFKAVLIPFLNWKLDVSSGFLKKLLWVDAVPSGFGSFSTLPVDYSKKLTTTSFAREYFEEMLLNYMDTLNTLYVATTRAKSYLYIVCPKTNMQEKKADTGKNELQQLLLNLFKQELDPELRLEDTIVSFGTLEKSAVQAKPTDNQGLLISRYLVNDDFATKFNYQQHNEESWFNARQRKGVALHSILEKLSDPAELDRLIQLNMQDGMIRRGEGDEVRQAVTDVLDQPEISSWFKGAEKIISERDMILEDGTVKRPDKLFVLKDYAVLLDFKFGAEQARYLEDIAQYRNNLLKMQEFTKVEAYIWYAESKKLLKVS